MGQLWLLADPQADLTWQLGTPCPSLSLPVCPPQSSQVGAIARTEPWESEELTPAWYVRWNLIKVSLRSLSTDFKILVGGCTELLVLGAGDKPGEFPFLLKILSTRGGWLWCGSLPALHTRGQFRISPQKRRSFWTNPSVLCRGRKSRASGQKSTWRCRGLTRG